MSKEYKMEETLHRLALSHFLLEAPILFLTFSRAARVPCE